MRAKLHWEAGSKDKLKQNARWGATSLVSSIPSTAVLTAERRLDTTCLPWPSQASCPSSFNPTDLFYLIDCPPHKDTPMASILQREPADHGRFLNHIEFMQGSETDARFEPKAVCLWSPLSFHCSHHHISGLNSRSPWSPIALWASHRVGNIWQ